MAINWVGVYNLLWKIIDSKGDCYFSGPRFLDTVREVMLDLPGYGEFIRDRQAAGKSTSRKDYFRDVLMELDEPSRWRVVNAILESVEHCDQNLASEIRISMGGPGAAPTATVPPDLWNATRLNNFLADIDAAIGAGNYERAVSLSYTCLEGFYGAFFRAKTSGQQAPNELIDLSHWVRDHLRTSIPDCPGEVPNLVKHVSHAIDKARNRFSESHFGNDADRWLATYVRNLANVQIRLLLHFM
jgi:hypothetical protein